jgi:hypothetical protein
MKYLIAAALAASIVPASAYAQSLSYYGWSGSADIADGRFVGCHLDSPPPTDENLVSKSPIHVVANSTTEFFLRFNTHFQYAVYGQSAPPIQAGPGKVSLFLFPENPLNVAWNESEHPGYTKLWPISVRILDVNISGDSLVGYLVDMSVLMRLPSDNIDNLKSSKYFWVYLIEPMSVESTPALISLRHAQLGSPSTWLNQLGANDTYGAVQTVLDCVRSHAS